MLEKPDGGGPVTEADIEVDRMLRGMLGAARPDYGWLSEESEDGVERIGATRVFIVDPIDGTRGYPRRAAGLGAFAGGRGGRAGGDRRRLPADARPDSIPPRSAAGQR